MAFQLFGRKSQRAKEAVSPASSAVVSPASSPPLASQDGERGEKLFELNAIPAKEILRNKSNVCPPLSACCEILDNIFDNFDENGSKGPLTIRFTVETSQTPTRVTIVENSGGVKRDKLEPLVRLGVPYHGAKGSIGTWGEGLKVAAFSLGRDVEIRTHFPGEQPVSVHFGSDWLSRPEWSVPVFAVKANPPAVGSTQFMVSDLVREVDWSNTMREIATIYGHKIMGIQQRGRQVSLEFFLNGSAFPIIPRPLASMEALCRRLSFPPDFSPRRFHSEWEGPHGEVKAAVIVGLTARHSTDTSGVYIYGNGRLFARAQRTKTVGYGEGGNSVLRDHPSCWRIHIYAFIEADDGSDIPWQAPLKDGVSENHPITAQLRELIKKAVTPYSRFAKAAKASELVPYTVEWNEMSQHDRARMLFENDEPASLERLRRLPKEFDRFVAPATIEDIDVASPEFEKLLGKLDRHSTYARLVIAKRDAQGHQVQEMAMRALNPMAFSNTPLGPSVEPEAEAIPQSIRLARTRRVTLELREVHLERLHEVFKIDDDREAIMKAIKFSLERLEKKSIRRA